VSWTAWWTPVLIWAAGMFIVFVVRGMKIAYQRGYAQGQQSLGIDTPAMERAQAEVLARAPKLTPANVDLLLRESLREAPETATPEERKMDRIAELKRLAGVK
jgi:hypothetical protein